MKTKEGQRHTYSLLLLLSCYASTGNFGFKNENYHWNVLTLDYSEWLHDLVVFFLKALVILFLRQPYYTPIVYSNCIFPFIFSDKCTSFVNCLKKQRERERERTKLIYIYISIMTNSYWKVIYSSVIFFIFYLPNFSHIKHYNCLNLHHRMQIRIILCALLRSPSTPFAPGWVCRGILFVCFCFQLLEEFKKYCLWNLKASLPLGMILLH